MKTNQEVYFNDYFPKIEKQILSFVKLKEETSFDSLKVQYQSKINDLLLEVKKDLKLIYTDSNLIDFEIKRLKELIDKTELSYQKFNIMELLNKPLETIEVLVNENESYIVNEVQFWRLILALTKGKIQSLKYKVNDVFYKPFLFDGYDVFDDAPWKPFVEMDDLLIEYYKLIENN